MSGTIQHALAYAQSLRYVNLNNCTLTADDPKVENTSEAPQIAVNPERIKEPCAYNSNYGNVSVASSITKRWLANDNNLNELMKLT